MADPVLTTQQRNQVRNILTTLSDFTDYGIRGRREFAASAGLGIFVPGIAWDGSDRTVAGALVDRANGHGFLHEPPSYHAVGALLAYMIEHPETNRDDEQFLAELVVEHGLVTDPEYVEQLRASYAIAAEPPARSRRPDVPARTAALAGQVEQPSFIPQVSDREGLERARNSEDNFLDIVQLLGAIYAAEAVGFVELPGGQALGTGWLIGPDLLLTNYHVLPSRDHVAEASVRFGFRQDALDVKVSDGRSFPFNSDLYYSSPEAELDYALVGLAEEPLAEMKVEDETRSIPMLELLRLGKHRGYLVPVPRMLLNRMRVNIIQHPAGNPQKAVLTQNYVTDDMRPTRVHYTADTRAGSSGSPVFNRLWEVVALHHSGKPVPPIAGIEDVNEGIPMKAILKDLEARRTDQGQRLIGLLPRVK